MPDDFIQKLFKLKKYLCTILLVKFKHTLDSLFICKIFCSNTQKIAHFIPYHEIRIALDPSHMASRIFRRTQLSRYVRGNILIRRLSVN